jgi:hypothetical protein
VSSIEALKRATTLTLQVKVPTTLVTASNPELAMGEEYWKTNLEAADARSLHHVVARINLEACFEDTRGSLHLHVLWPCRSLG